MGRVIHASQNFADRTMSERENNMVTLPETKDLILHLEDGWLTIWLNRPDVRNALSNPMIAELRSVLETISGTPSIRGISFRGKGGMFCSGGDLKGFKAMFHGQVQDPEAVVATSRAIGELFLRIDTMPQVVVMMVEGAAMAGGLGMVCAGDVVIVTKDAKFALTEPTIGIPAAQIAPYVVQRIGSAPARRIMLTAARLDGTEAGRLGLADFVAEDAADLERIEAEVRGGVLRCAPEANAMTKQIVQATEQLDNRAMIAFAAERFARGMISEEAREGIGAFLEKRKPSWSVKIKP